MGAGKLTMIPGETRTDNRGGKNMSLFTRLIIIVAIVVSVTDVIEFHVMKEHPERLTALFVVEMIIVFLTTSLLTRTSLFDKLSIYVIFTTIKKFSQIGSMLQWSSL